MLSHDPRPDAAYILCQQLLVPLSQIAQLDMECWGNTFATLRVQVNAEAPRDTRHASFLLHIDQHLPDGLDEHVAR